MDASLAELAQQERQGLCDLFVELGPDAPTLCDGWTASDLAAHLVVRERRPDSGPGLVWPPLAGYTDKVRRAGATAPHGRSWLPRCAKDLPFCYDRSTAR